MYSLTICATNWLVLFIVHSKLTCPMCLVIFCTVLPQMVHNSNHITVISHYFNKLISVYFSFGQTDFQLFNAFFASLIWHLKANLYLLTNLFWKYYYGNVETIVKLSLNFISYKNEFFCNYFLKDRRFQQKLYVAYVICFIFTKVFNVIQVQFYKLLFLFSFF